MYMNGESEGKPERSWEKNTHTATNQTSTLPDPTVPKPWGSNADQIRSEEAVLSFFFFILLAILQNTFDFLELETLAFTFTSYFSLLTLLT